MNLRDRGDAGVPQGPHAVTWHQANASQANASKPMEVIVGYRKQQGGGHAPIDGMEGQSAAPGYVAPASSQQWLLFLLTLRRISTLKEAPQRHQSGRPDRLHHRLVQQLPHQSGAAGSLRPTLQEESQLDYETPTTPVTACFPSPQLLNGTEAWEPNWGPVLFHRPYDC